ncbi:FAD binding domain-containing protein [Mytilinidion resinicola]|uniref:FAD binding domain-containing protein n=1 Tax=Mytilinidion resinicola TaxID=574789 RepID=A0A6A6YK42_9PEZI|nr:FAD binding domain-containing protein [Mytilinidion resinicola]KAF2808903.1 FAD binding domain-containing protein [Mytilinidion resinicola]
MDTITSLLHPTELILPSNPLYTPLSLVWSAQKNLSPRLVARPASLASLSRLLAALNTTDLDFAIRGGGCGSASASDVLISLDAFSEVTFDRATETVIVGAGQVWGSVDRKMEAEAPDYAVVGARCTYVGVGGSMLQGGAVSWISSEHGMGSDPHNMLDAQVVKMDGSVVWASVEPELLWALRGGGGNFGAVTAFKLKAYKYTSDVYSGMIMYPRSALPALAKAESAFAERCHDAKMAMHFFCLDLTQGAFTGQPTQPGVAILVYDAHGEKHGRSEAGFKWALEIEGATDATKSMSLWDVNRQSDNLDAMRGLTNQMMSAITIPAFDEAMIHRTWNWFDQLLAEEPLLNAGTFVLVELMQRPAFNSTKSSEDTAWPRPSNRHIMQLGTGGLKGCSPEVHAKAVKGLADAQTTICPESKASDLIPRDFEVFHDPKAMFGANWERLVKVKKAVDPKGRLRGAYKIPT